MEARFTAAAAFVQEHRGDARLTQDVQLELYGLFKRATVGIAPDAAPVALWDVAGRAKWNAWRACTASSQDEARAAYCAVVTRLFGVWEPPAAHDGDGFFLFDGGDARAASSSAHAFWDAQPMPNKWGESTSTPVQPELINNRIAVDVSPVPLALPPHLEWCDDRWADAPLRDICAEVHQLSQQGVDASVLSFSPAPEFLHWSMNPPAMRRDWLVGFRDRTTGVLQGFICGLPCSVSITGALVERMVEIKNLYVHPDQRGNRLAPILIAEVTRRVTRLQYCSALYTSAVTITRPLCKARYYQRPLNFAKLVATRYKEVPRGQTLERLHRKYAVDSSAPVSLAGWRRLGEEEVDAACELLNAHLARFSIHQQLSTAELRHWFVDCPAAVHAYVSGPRGNLESFCAWHTLDASAVANCGERTVVRGAFAHYSAVRQGSALELIDVYEAMLTQAARQGVDVLLCLDVGGNEDFLLDFARVKADVTSEYLLYHLVRWRSCHGSTLSCGRSHSTTSRRGLASPTTSTSTSSDTTISARGVLCRTAA